MRTERFVEAGEGRQGVGSLCVSCFISRVLVVDTSWLSACRAFYTKTVEDVPRPGEPTHKSFFFSPPAGGTADASVADASASSSSSSSSSV